MTTEPVALAACVRAILLAVMAFGFDIKPEQLAAVMFAVEAILAIVTRSKVEPTQRADARVEQAHAQGDLRVLREREAADVQMAAIISAVEAGKP